MCCVCVCGLGGDIGNRISFFLDLLLYLSTFLWHILVEEFYKNLKGYPISDILSGVYLIMIELLTNAQQLLHSTVEKRKIKEKTCSPENVAD